MTTTYPSPELLYRALGATLAVAEAFPSSALESRPAPGMMTVAEIIDHLAFNLEYVIEPIAAWLSLPKASTSATAPINRLQRANTRVRDVLDKVPHEDWLTDIAYPDNHTMSVVRAALVMLEHDAHHRGQLVVVLRALGIEPPKRWTNA